MLPELATFLVVVFVVVVFVLWRSRRGGDRDVAPLPMPPADRPEAAISNESTVGPHRNVGRPWRVDRGGPGPDGGGSSAAE